MPLSRRKSLCWTRTPHHHQLGRSTGTGVGAGAPQGRKRPHDQAAMPLEDYFHEEAATSATARPFPGTARTRIDEARRKRVSSCAVFKKKNTYMVIGRYKKAYYNLNTELPKTDFPMWAALPQRDGIITCLPHSMVPGARRYRRRQRHLIWNMQDLPRDCADMWIFCGSLLKRLGADRRVGLIRTSPRPRTL